MPLVRELVRSGTLRGLQLGGRSFWLVGLDALDDYIASMYGATAADIAAGRFSEETEALDATADPA